MKALYLPSLFLVTFPTHQFVGYIWTFLLVSHFLPFAHFSLVLRCSKLMVSLQCESEVGHHCVDMDGTFTLTWMVLLH